MEVLACVDPTGSTRSVLALIEPLVPQVRSKYEADYEPSAMPTNPHDFMKEDNPTTQGEFNKRHALNWIYGWGYSTASILQALLAHEGMSWTTNAVRAGWLRKTGITSRERVRVVTLTQKGLSWVEERRSELLRYSELDPHRISPNTVWHNLLAQRVTIRCIRAGEAKSYRTERQEAAKSQRGSKQPDAVLITQHGERIGVEIELNAKWDQRFDEFVRSTIDALSESPEGEPARFQRFIVMTTAPAIAKRYRQAFQPDAPLRVWRAKEKGQPVVDRLIHIPNWVSDRIEFRVIKDNGDRCLRTEQEP